MNITAQIITQIDPTYDSSFGVHAAVYIGIFDPATHQPAPGNGVAVTYQPIFGGTPGTQIVAAAAGSVVYAGNGLRGYGNLLIVKHNADYLTAYAHNRALLVKEGQNVTQGQPIAEMGDSDTNRVMLHFELRYKGSSIDPSRYLPSR